MSGKMLTAAFLTVVVMSPLSVAQTTRTSQPTTSPATQPVKPIKLIAVALENRGWPGQVEIAEPERAVELKDGIEARTFVLNRVS